MSKYGVFIIIALIAVTIGFSTWQVLSGNSIEDQLQSTFSGESQPELGAKFSDEVVDQLSLQIDMDKDIYYSNDLAKYSVKIKNNKDANNLMLEINGLSNKYGTDYIKEKKLVSLVKDVEQSVEFSKKLPVCNTCSGFEEDDYQIEVKVYRGSFELASKIITFHFADKPE